MSMFCYQCEQTMKGQGCTIQGVCGKDETTARLQDLIVHLTKGIAMYASRARDLGKTDREINVFTAEAMFSTITNVNFDPGRLQHLIAKAAKMKSRAKKLYDGACRAAKKSPEDLGGPAKFEPGLTLADLLRQADEISIAKRRQNLGEDATGLQEMLTYGLKGASAYADHAQILGQEDEKVYAYFHRALDFLAGDPTDANDLLKMCLECGQINLRVMELLDAANTGTYGHQVPTKVRVTPVKGKAILISGHDLKDLEELLKQTEGKGINVYTHGEMLTCHAYPKLKMYKHFVGNYGSAWQNQQHEFAEFPGSILMTTNCLQKPQKAYAHRIFTSGLVAWPNVVHIADRNFTPVIETALGEEGFKQTEPEKFITVGFGRNAVIGVADKVVDAVKKGKIRHFFLIGGCDGAKPGRNYYTEFAQKVPRDCVILTLACGKYRFNKLEFGDIDGIPRLLDMGQCNDSYSAIQVASALAKAFGTDVNGLPLSLVLSWYEQKAVVILLTLLSLGLKNIRLGPSLPAFVTPAVLKTLAQKFNIMPISTPDQDLRDALA